MSLAGGEIRVEITSPHMESLLQGLLVPYRRTLDGAVIEGETALVLARLLRLGETLDPSGELQGLPGDGDHDLRDHGYPADDRHDRDEGRETGEGHAKAPEASGPRPLPCRKRRRQRKGPACGLQAGGRGDRRRQRNLPFVRTEKALQQMPGVQRGHHTLPKLPEVRTGHEGREDLPQLQGRRSKALQLWVRPQVRDGAGAQEGHQPRPEADQGRQAGSRASRSSASPSKRGRSAASTTSTSTRTGPRG